MVPKTSARHWFTTGFSTEWHVLRPFPPNHFAHPLGVAPTFPHTAMNHIARRAIEGCGSCLQEPTNESDVIVIVIELVFVVVVNSLQGL